MSKIILVRGIQGSGKSTWAKQWVSEQPNSRMRWSNDDFYTLGGVYWPNDSNALKRREKCMLTIRENSVKTWMSEGYDIVIDNMNLNDKEVTYWENIIRINNEGVKESLPGYSFEYTLEFKDFFNVSLKECIRRDSTREHPIGASVIKQTYNRYRTKILATMNKNFINSIKIEDSSKEKIVIFDLDGTIAYNTHGRPFFGEGTAEGICNDTPDSRMIELLNTYRIAGVKVGFLTGRTDTPEIRKATKEWIEEHIGNGYEFLIMRPNTTFVPGDECKYNLYKSLIEPKYRVLAVYEDSQKCVDMWRKEGILCLQPNDGNC